MPLMGAQGSGPAEAFPEPFDVVVTRPDRFMMLPLDDPAWRQPSMVFVNSLSDLFHKDVSTETIARAFAVMQLADQHIYQFLTKRPGRMCSLLGSRDFLAMVDDQREAIRPGCGDFEWPLPNVWGGVSVEHQDTAYRIDKLLATPLAVRWVSAEPLLGPLVLRPEWMWATRGVHWVVVGGESGSGARPMDIRWAGQLAEQCATAGVPYFFKQTGSVLARQLGLPGKGDDPARWPTHLSPEVWRQEYPERPSA
jgi:protein gp37